MQNAVTGKLENRISMKTVDDPESPAIAPDGRHVVFSALRGAIGDIFMLDLDTGKIEQPDQRRVCRLRADVLPGRLVHRLHGARQRQREAVPPRPRQYEEESNT